MTKKYICTLCGEPCILQLKDNAAEPYACPFGETDYPEWELMKEDDQKMIQIECDLFKENGKWYTTELVNIPADTPDWNVPNVVKNNRRATHLIYVGKMRCDVPFLIPVDGSD